MIHLRTYTKIQKRSGLHNRYNKKYSNFFKNNFLEIKNIGLEWDTPLTLPSTNFCVAGYPATTSGSPVVILLINLKLTTMKTLSIYNNNRIVYQQQCTTDQSYADTLAGMKYYISIHGGAIYCDHKSISCYY